MAPLVLPEVIIAVSLLAWSKAFTVPLSSQVLPWEQSGLELVRTLGINVAAMIGVGALSFIFGDQLQRGAETLATTRRAAADLHAQRRRAVRQGGRQARRHRRVPRARRARATVRRTRGRIARTARPGSSTHLMARSRFSRLRRASARVGGGGRSSGARARDRRSVPHRSARGRRRVLARLSVLRISS